MVEERETMTRTKTRTTRRTGQDWIDRLSFVERIGTSPTRLNIYAGTGGLDMGPMEFADILPFGNFPCDLVFLLASFFLDSGSLVMLRDSA